MATLLCLAAAYAPQAATLRLQWMLTSKELLNKELTLGRLDFHEKILNIATNVTLNSNNSLKPLPLLILPVPY